MEKTVVAVFESDSQANQARSQLIEAGFPQSDVTVKANTSAAASRTSATTDSTDDEGGIVGWFRSLFGSDDDEMAGRYSEAVRRNNSVLTVRATSDDHADKAADILDSCGAIDIDERAAEWSRQTGDTANAAGVAGRSAAIGAPTGQAPIPSDETQKLSVIQEDVQIAKRAVQRGGVRIVTRVTETPVEETVQLREELVRVERNPVDRAATAADLAAMKGETIELREMGEEAVVGKVARVTEEIEVGKKVLDREKTVRETVRHTDVQVEDLSREDAPVASNPSSTASSSKPKSS